MQIDEIRFVNRGDTCLQDIVADKFADCDRGGCVNRRSEDFENGPDNASDDAAATSVAHADGVCAEKNDWLKNLRGREDETADGVRSCSLTVGISCFGSVVWI